MRADRHGEPMKALSLRQPWLWAVLELGKVIENRRWNTRFRGPVLLHAAKGCTVDECVEALEWIATARNGCPPVSYALLERGGICGYAEIDGVLYPDGHPLAAATLASFRANAPDADRALRWKMPEQYGFVLRNVRRLPFVP